MFPPGCDSLAIKPKRTESARDGQTIGMIEVSFLTGSALMTPAGEDDVRLECNHFLCLGSPQLQIVSHPQHAQVACIREADV
jgi:hypothetical protein